MQEVAPNRKRRSKWRVRAWIILIGCVAVMSAVLAEGFFHSADFVLKLEAFAAFFIVGCVLILVSRRSAVRKKRDGRP
jgi:hypothetical protein